MPRVGKVYAAWVVTSAVLRFKEGRGRVDFDSGGTWRWEVTWRGEHLSGAGRPTQQSARQAVKRALAQLQVPDQPWPRTKRRIPTSYMSANPVTPAGHRWFLLDVRGDHLVRRGLSATVCGKQLKVRGRVRRVRLLGPREEPSYLGSCLACARYSWGTR